MSVQKLQYHNNKPSPPWPLTNARGETHCVTRWPSHITSRGSPIGGKYYDQHTTHIG